MFFKFIILYLFFIYNAFAQELNFSKDEKEWIEQNKKVVIGINEVAPYKYLKNDKLVGYHIDFFKMLFENSNLKVEFTPILSFETLISKMKNNEIDIIPGLTKNSEREEFMSFSTNVSMIKMGILAQEENNQISNLNSINGKTIASFRNYGLNNMYKKKYPNSEILYTNDSLDMLNSVSLGKADVCIMEIQSAKYTIRRSFIPNVNIKSIFEIPAHMWGVRKNLPILHSIMEKLYEHLTEAQKQKLWEKWFVENYDPTTSKLTDEEIEYLKNNTFKRAYPDEWKPFYMFSPSGENDGLAEDYWKLIKSKIFFNEVITKKDLTFSNILNSIKNGETDFYPGTTQTSDRAQYASFSIPYETFPIAIATNPNINFINSTSILNDKIVAVAKNTSAYYLMKEKYPNIRYLLVENIQEAIKKVESDEAFAAIDVLPILKYYVQSYDSNKVVFAGITDVNFSMQIMVNKNNKKLVSILNKAITKITPQDKTEILKKWIHNDIIEKTDYSLLWKILSFVGIIIFIIIIWNWSLRKKIDKILKEKQEQEIIVFQQSKKAEIGTILGAITHQIKQPLNIIGLIIADMQFHFLTSNKDKINFEDSFDKISNQIEFMSNTIDEFKNFYKPNNNISTINPIESLNRLQKMISGLFIESKIEINILKDDSFLIKGNENNLMQVFLIIFNNSKDAFVGRNIKDRKIDCFFEIEGNKGVIKIVDNAGGISENLLPNKIFESYTSTKGDKSMGIGLNICKKIIEQQINGKISAFNYENGAMIKIELPILN